MYEEIYEYPPIQEWGKLKSTHNHSARGRWRWLEDKHHFSEYGFQCRHCQAYVYTQPVYTGVQSRNHCPYCLWSRHMDHIQPGDRMSACKAIMQPIGLTVKRRSNKYNEGIDGELMLIHRCKDCGKVSINRIAADDQAERLMELYQESASLDMNTRDQLRERGIHLLLADNGALVINQLRGKL